MSDEKVPGTSLVAANSADQQKLKKKGVPGRPFVAGQSGNPSGRPKRLGEVTELARSYTVEAIEALVRGLQDPRHYPACAQELLNRAWGKAPTIIAGDEDSPIRMVVSWQPSKE